MGLMFRRRRPLARLAVGAATAGVAYHAGKRAQQDEYDEQASEPYEASQRARPARIRRASTGFDRGGEVDELSRLAQMHDSGALSDDEFAAAKAQLLGRSSSSPMASRRRTSTPAPDTTW
jgi:hypothetical protein